MAESRAQQAPRILESGLGLNFNPICFLWGLQIQRRRAYLASFANPDDEGSADRLEALDQQISDTNAAIESIVEEGKKTTIDSLFDARLAYHFSLPNIRQRAIDEARPEMRDTVRALYDGDLQENMTALDGLTARLSSND